MEVADFFRLPLHTNRTHLPGVCRWRGCSWDDIGGGNDEDKAEERLMRRMVLGLRNVMRRFNTGCVFVLYIHRHSLLLFSCRYPSLSIDDMDSM